MNSKLQFTESLDALSFRQGMAHLAAAVNIITTCTAQGQAGFTASAVCSVTDQPATLLVCINQKSSVFEYFQNSDVLCVNTLSHEQQALANLFASKTPQNERFHANTWATLKTGAPVLTDALVAFDCLIRERQVVGSHMLLICEVQAMQSPKAAQALVYFNRQYCAPIAMPH